VSYRPCRSFHLLRVCGTGFSGQRPEWIEHGTRRSVKSPLLVNFA